MSKHKHDWFTHDTHLIEREILSKSEIGVRWMESYWVHRRTCLSCDLSQYAHRQKFVYYPRLEWWDVEPLPVARLLRRARLLSWD